MDSVNNIITTLADKLFLLVVPLGVIGIMLGVAMTVFGYHHGTATIRTALVVTAIAALAKVIIAVFTTAAAAPKSGALVPPAPHVARVASPTRPASERVIVTPHAGVA